MHATLLLVWCWTVPPWHTGRWESLSAQAASTIALKYFEMPIHPSDRCELFTVSGVPAALLVYNHTRTRGTETPQPVVQHIRLNRGLLFLVDAGECMRKQLFTRFPGICLHNATNRDVFLLF